jgi:hypothetical protein
MTVEDSFRVWAFNTAYKMFADEYDLTARFAMALEFSQQDVPPGTAKKWKATVQALRTMVKRVGDTRIGNMPANRQAFADSVTAIISEHMGVVVKWRAWELDNIMEAVMEADEVMA